MAGPTLVRLPKNTCDTHFHIFGPYDRYPLQAERGYTPPEATIEQYHHLTKMYGIDRSVIVQPSTYGGDLSLLIDVLGRFRETMRGVAAIGADVSDEMLSRLDQVGVRGVRFNLLFAGGTPLGEARAIADRIRRFGWLVQILTDLSQQAIFYDNWRDFPVPLVIDHLGHLATRHGVDAPGFRGLLRLLQEGKAWAKLSGVYRVTDSPYPFEDALPFVRALVEANPERVLWGTDWPHPAVPMKPKFDELVNVIPYWLPTCALREQVLVKNPERLYGF